MIFDVILILIFLLLIVINAVRGASRSLSGIIASIISYFLAAAFAGLLADWIYESFLRPAITQTITQAVNDAGANAAGTVTESIPAWLAGMLQMSGGDLNKMLSQPVANVSGTVANAVNDAVKPIAISFLTIILTIILFLIFVIILRLLLRKPIEGLMKLPVLNGIDHFFGAVIGFVSAFLLVSLLAYLVKLILSNMPAQSGWFSESNIYNSFIFYHFYSGNIFTWITSLIHF